MFKFKNDNRCRVCKHPHYWSLYNHRIMDCSVVKCPCTFISWAPIDNLEYLEGLSENKK